MLTAEEGDTATAVLPPTTGKRVSFAPAPEHEELQNLQPLPNLGESALWPTGGDTPELSDSCGGGVPSKLALAALQCKPKGQQVRGSPQQSLPFRPGGRGAKQLSKALEQSPQQDDIDSLGSVQFVVCYDIEFLCYAKVFASYLFLLFPVPSHCPPHHLLPLPQRLSSVGSPRVRRQRQQDVHHAAQAVAARRCALHANGWAPPASQVK